MRRHVFINLVDRPRTVCAHAQLIILGMPIDDLMSARARRTCTSDSIVRGFNPRRGVFYDYIRVFEWYMICPLI